MIHFKCQTDSSISVIFRLPYGDWRFGLDKLKNGHYIKAPKYVNDLKGYYPYIQTLKHKVFRFKIKDKNKAIDILSKFNTKNHTMVSIHIRLTDYEDHLIKLFHTTDNIKSGYFERAMTYFVEKYKVSYK